MYPRIHVWMENFLMWIRFENSHNDLPESIDYTGKTLYLHLIDAINSVYVIEVIAVIAVIASDINNNATNFRI